MNVQRIIETNVNIWNYTHKGVKRRLRRMLQAAAAFHGEESCITVECCNKYGSFSYSKRGEANPTIIEKVYVGYPCRDTFYLNPTVNKTHETWNFTVDKALKENLKYWPARNEPWYYYPEKYEELWEFPYDKWVDWVLPF